MFLWLCIILTVIAVLTPKTKKDNLGRIREMMWTPSKLLMVIIAWIMYALS